MKKNVIPNPSPAELASFLRSLGQKLPSEEWSFRAGLSAWLKWVEEISAARAELEKPPAPRVKFDEALKRMKCSAKVLRSYWNEGTFVSVEGDQGWILRKCEGFSLGEIQDMEQEQRKRAVDKARKGAIAKNKNRQAEKVAR